MNQRERNDAIFAKALTPAASPSLTSGLAAAIHDALVATPQERTSSRWSFSPRFLFQGRLGVVVVVILTLLAAIAFIVALASRPKPSPLGITTYRGGPERTGVMPGPGPSGDPIQLWTVDAKGPVGVMPAVIAGVVYVADDSGTVQGLDETTGAVVWIFEVGSPVTGSPAVEGGRIFLGTEAGEVLALDIANRNVAWRFPTTGPVRASPAIVGGALYIGSDDGNVFALDAATGTLRWARPLGAAVTRGVAVADGVVYAGATGGRFVALDSETGDVRWQAKTLGPGEVGTPMVADGLVFAASGLLEVGPSDKITALDVRDGSARWTFPSPDGQPVYNGAVGNGAVYISSNNGNVYRLDETTGKEAPGWPFRTRAAIGYLAGLVDGVLYVSSSDHYIYAVDVGSGLEIWKFELKGAPNVPAIVDGRIFVGTDLGKIVAIGGTEPTATGQP